MIVGRKIFFILTFVFVIQNVFAQRSNKILLRADLAYEDLEYYNAARLYEVYYKTDSSVQKVLLRIADCHWNMRQYERARFWYSKVSKEVLLTSDTLTKRFAELYAMAGDYHNARETLWNLKKYQKRAQGFSQRDRFLKDSADWSVQYLNINTEKYREFSPMLLGTSIIWSTNEPRRKNGEDVFGWDANGFVRQKFMPNKNDIGTREIPSLKLVKESISKQRDRNIAKSFAAADVSIRSKGNMSNIFLRTRKLRMNQPQDLQIFKKLQYNIGHATASSDASKMYLTVNVQNKIADNTTRSLGIVEADIMSSYVANPIFLPLFSLNPIDSNENILHGAIDPMGKYLIFSSNRAGGKGGFDLYASIKSLDGKWSIPEPIESLNSVGDEVFSAFSANGDFYYSSDGMPGLGGLDIYKVKTTIAPYTLALLFENPEHLPYPINSDHDDFGLVLSEDNHKGYFTSDRYGSDDIFSFEFNRKFIPLSGTVIEKSNGLRVEGIPASLYELNEDGTVVKVDSVLTDKNGLYTFSNARPNKQYFIKVFEPVSETYNQNVTIITASTEPEGLDRGLAVATVEIPNSRMQIEKTLKTKSTDSYTVNQQDAKLSLDTNFEKILRQSGEKYHEKMQSSEELLQQDSSNRRLSADSFYAIVYFGFDQYLFTTKAIRTLDSVVAYMKSNPNDEFILLGHADEVGGIEYNKDLSKRRVFAVTRYIGSKGVNTKRLKLSFFGEQRPAQTNKTSKEFLRLNRRVEFKLIKNDLNNKKQ